MFAVGTRGAIFHFNGTEWRRQYSGTAENFNSVRGTSSHDVYAAGPNDTLYHYDGVSWSRMSGNGLDYFRIWPLANDVMGLGAEYVDVITRPLLPAEERCQDPWDNDGKDGINCDDPDCNVSLYCVRGGSCETLEHVECGAQDKPFTTYTGIAKLDDLICLDHSTPGPEASVRFVATSTGPVTVTIADASGTLDLVVVEAEKGACKLDTCTRATRGDDSTQTVTFDAIEGRMYFVLVDGPAYTAAPFTMSVSCPSAT